MLIGYAVMHETVETANSKRNFGNWKKNLFPPRDWNLSPIGQNPEHQTPWTGRPSTTDNCQIFIEIGRRRLWVGCECVRIVPSLTLDL